MTTKKPIYVWNWRSSDGKRVYETLQYIDSSLSCSCPGWCKRVAGDGSRSCKHTRLVFLGCKGHPDLISHGPTGSGVTHGVSIFAAQRASISAPVKSKAEAAPKVAPNFSRKLNLQ